MSRKPNPAKGIGKDIRDARKSLDWEAQFKLMIDPEKARSYRAASEIGGNKECTMCGEFCAVKTISAFLKKT